MQRIGRRTVAAGLGTAVVAVGTLAGSGSDPAGASAVPAVPAWGTTVSAPAGVQGVLNGVAAASATDVVAVGAHTDGPDGAAYLRDAYAEHWNGTAWTATAVPVPAFGQNQTSVLVSAAAAGPADSWAVGSVGSTAGEFTLAEHWNGSTWTRTPTPSPGTQKSDHLYDVAARGPADVWAVGDYGPDPSRSLLLHWNGSTWNQVAVPNIGVLRAVTTDAGSVWVASHSTVLRMTSTGWTQLPPPTGIAPSDEPVINAIARSGSNLWVVGLRAPGAGGEIGEEAAYAAYWNGSRWTAVNPHGESALTDTVAVTGGIEAPMSNQVFQVTTNAVSRAVTPISPYVSLSGIAVDPAGHRWAVGLIYGEGTDPHMTPGIIASPVAGQGGIITTGGSLVTWLGPVNGSVAADDSGTTRVGGLPTGTYTVIVARSYCTPGVQKVTVRAGQATTVTARTVC